MSLSLLGPHQTAIVARLAMFAAVYGSRCTSDGCKCSSNIWYSVSSSA